MIKLRGNMQTSALVSLSTVISVKERMVNLGRDTHLRFSSCFYRSYIDQQRSTRKIARAAAE